MAADLRRMVLPLLVAAGLIASGMVWFNNEVLPAANYRWRVLMMDVAQTSPLLLLQPQIINSINTGDGSSRYFIQATDIDQATNRLGDVTIYDVSDPDVSRTIYADSARMQQNARPGSILVTEATHRAVLGFFETRDLGDVLHVLGAQSEPDLLVGEAGDVAGRTVGAAFGARGGRRDPHRH